MPALAFETVNPRLPDWTVAPAGIDPRFHFNSEYWLPPLLSPWSFSSVAAVPWLLVVFGAGLFVGNILGGKAADRRLDPTLVVLLIGLTVVMALFALTAANPVATVVALVLMGGFGFGTVPGLQTRIMLYADTAPTLASSANIAAFNVGNALGAWIGGITISVGLGYTSPLWAGAGITAAAALVMIIAATRRTVLPSTTPADTPASATPLVPAAS